MVDVHNLRLPGVLLHVGVHARVLQPPHGCHDHPGVLQRHSPAPVPRGPRTRAPSRQEPDGELLVDILRLGLVNHVIGSHY